jgi:hypothetical protein
LYIAIIAKAEDDWRIAGAFIAQVQSLAVPLSDPAPV